VKCTKMTRLETLPKVCALAFAFSTAHIIARSATQCAALHYAQRYTAPRATLRPGLHCAQRYTARSIAQCPALHCTANIVQRSELAAVGPSREKPSAAASGGTAQRSTALPVQQRLETLPKVCALAFVLSTAHKQRAALNSARR